MKAHLLRKPHRHAQPPPEKHEASSQSHVIVRLVADNGRILRDDSGRLVLSDDIDVPEVFDFSDRKGR